MLLGITSFFLWPTIKGKLQDAKLALGFMTLHTCDCLFVMQKDEDYCTQYVANKYVKPDIKIDYESKKVTGSFSSFFLYKSQYSNHRYGCTLSL